MTDILKKSETKVEINSVPHVDMDAPLTVPMNESTDYSMGVTPKNKFIYILGTVGFITIILITFGTLFYYLTSFKGKAEDKRLVVIENNTLVETPKTFDKGQVTFEVLNGSGVAGEARKIGNRIEEVGYKVISTGNATQIKGNKLYLNESSSGFASQIIADLGNFNISSVSGVLTDSTASARLIIGK